MKLIFTTLLFMANKNNVPLPVRVNPSLMPNAVLFGSLLIATTREKVMHADLSTEYVRTIYVVLKLF